MIEFFGYKYVKNKNNFFNLTVIVPFFNNSNYFEVSVRSIINQSLPVSEIIVIDDGSEPSEAAALKILCDINNVIYIRKDNGGVSSARNLGLKYCSSDYVLFLDSDDVLKNKSIEMFGEALALERVSKKTKIFVFPFLYKIMENNDWAGQYLIWSMNFIPPRLFRGANILNFNLMLQQNCFPISSVVFSRKLIDKCGIFDEELSTHEDWDFWLKLVLKVDHIIYGKNMDVFTLINIRSGLSANRDKMSESFGVVRNRYITKTFLERVFYYNGGNPIFLFIKKVVFKLMSMLRARRVSINHDINKTRMM